MKKLFVKGISDSIPIALGYFAVSFALGIKARSVGLTAVQAGLASFLNNASAGENALFDMIGANANYLLLAVTILITNARYLLMSCSLSQKLSEDVSTPKRMLLGYDITDEIFALGITYDGTLPPVYMYGVFVLPLIGWAAGTFFGVVMGDILPASVVTALSVALYGMFIAIIIPPARKDKGILLLVTVSMLISFLCTHFNLLPGELRVVVLTVVLSAAAAIIRPIEEAAQ